MATQPLKRRGVFLQAGFMSDKPGMRNYLKYSPMILLASVHLPLR
jgi:hypothetical protein